MPIRTIQHLLHLLRKTASVALLGICCMANAVDHLQYTTQSVKVDGELVSTQVLKIRINQVRFVVGLAGDKVGAASALN